MENEEPQATIRANHIPRKPDLPQMLIEDGESILIILKDNEMKTIDIATVYVAEGKILLSTK